MVRAAAWVLVAGTAIVASHATARADGDGDDDGGEIDLDSPHDDGDGGVPTPDPPLPPPPLLSPMPAHAAAFVAAYEALRGCELGAPPWLADAADAHQIQRALGRTCDPERARAVAIARAGEDADRHAHTLWLDVAGEVDHELGRSVAQVRRTDRTMARLGFVAPPGLAQIPTLDPARGTLVAGTERAMEIHASVAVGHRIAFRFERDGAKFAVASSGASARPTWTPPATYTDVLGVTGAGRERAFVQRVSRGGQSVVQLVRSHDAGKTWDPPRPLAGDVKAPGELLNMTLRPLADEIDLIWRTDKTHGAWQVLTETGGGKRVLFEAPSDTRFDTACESGDTRWWFDPRHLGWLDARGSHVLDPHVKWGTKIAACTRDGIALAGDDAVTVCDRTRCTTTRAPHPLVDVDERGAPVVVARMTDDLVVMGGRVVHAGGDAFAVTAGPEGPRLYVARDEGIFAFPIGAAP